MELIVLDDQFRATEIIDSYDSLLWVDRYRQCGDFEIYGPIDTKILSLMKNGKYISTRDSKHSMIVENPRATYDSVESNLMMTISGRSLESILSRRIIWKQTMLEGSLQDGLERLFNENIINPEKTERKISNFIFQKSMDPAITELNLTMQLTGDNLLDVVESVCEINDIGFSLTIQGTNLVFELYSGVDRSFSQLLNPYVIFSPKYDNLISSDYSKNDMSFKNVTLVAGQGEGPDRKTIEVGDIEACGIDRRELFTDARDLGLTYYDENNQQQELTETEYEKILSTRGEEKLSELKSKTNFESELDTTQTYTYGIDYNIGDIVQVETGYGIESRVRVTELIHSVSSDGYSVYPTFRNLEQE